MELNLENVIVGETLVISGNRSERLVGVKRLTATQIIVAEGENEIAYRKKDGKRVGGEDSWYSTILVKKSPEELEKIRDRNQRHNLIEKLAALLQSNNRVNLMAHKIPVALLQEAYQAIKPYTEASLKAK